MKTYLIAYDYYHVARYPAPNSPGKLKAYKKVTGELFEGGALLRSARGACRDAVPRPARRGSASIGLLRKPNGVEKPPVVIIWGGIDAFKEERPTEPYLRAGMATLCIDMPGVADAPLAGSEDGERLWDAVLDWMGQRTDLDSDRVGIVGGSTGGYWATKLPIAIASGFAPRSIMGAGTLRFYRGLDHQAQRGEYPFELAETLACAFGRSSAEEWIEYSPRLSLLDQGVLTRRCAPLLCVNGINDSVFSDCRHVFIARAWRSQDRSLLSRRPYGRGRSTAGDLGLVERKSEVTATGRLRGMDFLVGFVAG